MKLFESFNRRIGIDLGSSCTRIWVDGQGLIVNEPSLIAVDQRDQRVLAVGQEAKDMLGRVDETVQVFSPIKYPKIEDDDLVQALLKVLLNRLSQELYFFSPVMLVAVPSHTTPVVKDVLVQILTNLGASEVLLIEQPLAAMIGAGVPIADASGSFVLHLGESVVEAAALSLGKTVRTFVSYQAGSDMCQELIYWFRQEKNLKISTNIAKKVLQQLGNLSEAAQYKLGISGVSLQGKNLTEIEVHAQEIRQVLEPYGPIYLSLLKDLLIAVPPDLTIDVVDKGLLLSGGLAQLVGLEDYFIKHLHIPVSLVEEPDLAVIRGVGAVLKHLNEFKQSLAYS
jgi:rod shape-determining protein MreB